MLAQTYRFTETSCKRKMARRWLGRAQSETPSEEQRNGERIFRLRLAVEDAALFGLFAWAAYFVVQHMYIPSHKPEDFEGMRVAARLAAKALEHVGPYVKSGVTTAQLDSVVAEYITSNGGRSAPLGYKGFPKSTCISVNEEVCHGIPSEERELFDGDIVNIDVTAIVDGWHGDISRTFMVGGRSAVSEDSALLVKVTEEALELGLEQCRPGGRMGDIVSVIQRHAEHHNFSVVTDYVGHGIGRKFHHPPQIVHVGKPHQGTLLKKGMFFTVEPMINAGTKEIKKLDDGWTVITADGSLSAQFEHTVGIGEQGCEIFTRLK